MSPRSTPSPSGEALDPRALHRDPSHRPAGCRAYIGLDPAGSGTLRVTLSLPLDPHRSEERGLWDYADDRGLARLSFDASVDLDTEQQNLHRAIDGLYRSPFGHRLRESSLAPLPEAELREALMPVAVMGASIYRRLLLPSDDCEFRDVVREDREVAAKAARSVLRRISVLEFRSPKSLFPWAFLYGGKNPNHHDCSTLDPDCFLGFRHEIQVQVHPTNRRRSLRGPVEVLAAVCPDLDPRYHQRAIFDSPADSLPWLGNVRAVDAAPDLRDALPGFDGDCVYFFGHARQDPEPTPTTSRLELQGVDVTVEDLASAGGFDRWHNPVLVFLNGCGTGALRRWNEHSWAGFLCHRARNRVCCVVCSHDVPGALAAEFARHFWKAFLGERAPVGKALLEARRRLLHDYHNPLGLVYHLLGKAETRISFC